MNDRLRRLWPALCTPCLLVAINLFTLHSVRAIVIAAESTESSQGSTAEIIAAGAELKKIADGFEFTEGPASDREGNVYFTDQPNDRIVVWHANTGRVDDWLKPAGRSNGMYFDSEGNLLVCADEQNQLWSISPDKRSTVLIEKYESKLLNGPNDLWVHPTGDIYFTDPLYVRPYWKRESTSQQDGQHLYRWNKASNTVHRVANDFRQPNGIVGTPDGKILYVADIGAGKTFRYMIQSDGSLSDKVLFCELGSDGMTLDEQGNVYLTGRGVTVFNRDGKQIEQIAVPERWTANVTFGGSDHQMLFITASRAVYGLQMTVRGAAPVWDRPQAKLKN